ncbi:MAG: hypothetical protein ACYS0G_05830 [Planctomycetota bacterium]|jgi:hypothetical protein
MSKSSIRYLVTAVLISLCWYLLLQIAPNIRGILGGPRVLEVGTPVQLLLFAIAGTATAILFRSWITRARGATNIILGTLLPFVSAEIFCIFLVLYHLVRGTTDVWHAIIWGPWVALVAFWIVIPLGIATQFAMRWAGRADANRVSSPAG